MHATPRRRLRPRWVWSVLVLVAVTALTLGLIRWQETACAGRVPATPGEPEPGAARSGTAVYHDGWSVVLCSFAPLPADGRYVSLSPGVFDNAALCGGYLDVTGPQGTVRVQIVDRCRGCPPGRIDLSRAAFTKIGDLGKGLIPVRYRLVRDPMPARRLAVRVKDGSSPDWLALLVLDHGNPIARVELRGAGQAGWSAMRRGIDNYWSRSRPGAGPYQVRITDSYGRHGVVRSLTLSPGATQRTRTRLYEPRPAPFTASESPLPVPEPGGPAAPAGPATSPPEVHPHCP